MDPFGSLACRWLVGAGADPNGSAACRLPVGILGVDLLGVVGSSVRACLVSCGSVGAVAIAWEGLSQCIKATLQT